MAALVGWMAATLHLPALGEGHLLGRGCDQELKVGVGVEVGAVAVAGAGVVQRRRREEAPRRRLQKPRGCLLSPPPDVAVEEWKLQLSQVRSALLRRLLHDCRRV